MSICSQKAEVKTLPNHYISVPVRVNIHYEYQLLKAFNSLRNSLIINLRAVQLEHWYRLFEICSEYWCISTFYIFCYIITNRGFLMEGAYARRTLPIAVPIAESNSESQQAKTLIHEN